MAVGDRYQIKLYGRLLGQQVLNVFYCKSTEGDSTARDAVEALALIVNPHLIDLLNVGMVFSTMEGLNLDDPADLHIRSLNPQYWAGTVGGEVLPPFAAFAFQFLRGSAASRHGWKRFAGVSEASIENGVAKSEWQELAGDLSDLLEAPWNSVQPDCEFVPVIMRRPTETGPWLDFPVSGVVYRYVSTQNTRKSGRGS